MFEVGEAWEVSKIVVFGKLGGKKIFKLAFYVFFQLQFRSLWVNCLSLSKSLWTELI